MGQPQRDPSTGVLGCVGRASVLSPKAWTTSRVWQSNVAATLCRRERRVANSFALSVAS